MTIKEALECIVVDLTPKAKEHDKEEIEQLEKDLELLERYKAIEKEIGIDFITLFKALNGLYYKFRQEDREIYEMKVPMLRIINGEYCWTCPKWMTTTWMSVRVKDYGKTWALTKGELIDEK